MSSACSWGRRRFLAGMVSSRAPGEGRAGWRSLPLAPWLFSQLQGRVGGGLSVSSSDLGSFQDR